MSEFLSQPNPEHEMDVSITRLIEDRFPDDIEFLTEMDREEIIGYHYGALLGQGEDPDEVLQKYGVTEGNDEV